MSSGFGSAASSSSHTDITSRFELDTWSKR